MALGKRSRPGGRGLTFRSILAKPSPLDARSLASWKSSLRERLVSITERLPREQSQSGHGLHAGQKRLRPGSLLNHGGSVDIINKYGQSKNLLI